MEMLIDTFLNFITDEEVAAIENYVDNKVQKFEWRSSISWGEINKGSTNCSALMLPKELYLPVYYRLKNIYPDKINLDKFYCYFYIWHPLSLIKKHTDGNVSFGATIYLNKEIWDVDWGGLFYFFDENEVKIILPEFKKAVINKNACLHGVTTLNYFAPTRRSLQIFVDK